MLANGWMNGCIHVMHPMDIKYQIWNQMDVCMHACIHKGGFVQCIFCLFSFGNYIVWKLCLLPLPTTKARKDIVFRFIIEYSSLSDFGPEVIIGLFLYEDF